MDDLPRSVPSMDSSKETLPLLSHRITLNEAAEAFTAINILVLRTEGTSDLCYKTCLDYLRLHMRSLSVQDLRATQPDYEPDLKDRQRERYLLSIKFSESLAVAAEVDAAYISAQSVSQNILFPDVTSTAYVLGTSSKFSLVKEQAKLLINYLEDSPQYAFDPKLFHQGGIYAAIVIHDFEVEDSEAVKTLYNAEAEKIKEKYGVNMVHLLCRGTKGFCLFNPAVLCQAHPWLKYHQSTDRVRVDTSTEGFSNHTLNYIACKETVVLYNATTKITYFLRELVIHCIVCVVREFVSSLENNCFPESELLCSYDDPEMLKTMSRKQRSNFVIARTHKIHGDILMMLNNLPQAMNMYVQAKNRCDEAGDLLFKGAAGFCLAITLTWLAEQSNQELVEAKKMDVEIQETHMISVRRFMAHRLTKGLIRLTKPQNDRSSDVTPSSATSPPEPKGGRFGFPQPLANTTTPQVGNDISETYEDCSDDEGTVTENTSVGQLRQAACELPLTTRSEAVKSSASVVSSDHNVCHLGKAADRIVRTFTKAFIRWLQLKKLPLYEFEVCLLMLLHCMREEGNYQRIHFLISRMLEYAEKRMSADETINFLRYLIDFTCNTPYVRKLHYYQFLYEQKCLDNRHSVPWDTIEGIITKFMLRVRLPKNTTVISDIKECKSIDDGTTEVQVGDMSIGTLGNDVTANGSSNNSGSHHACGTSEDLQQCTCNHIDDDDNQHECSCEDSDSLKNCFSDNGMHPGCDNTLKDQHSCRDELGLTSHLISIIDEVSKIMCCPYISSGQMQARTQIGWRVTKFFEIQHAHVDMAIRQCETHRMHHAIAELSLINLMMAIDHVLTHHGSDYRTISKFEGYTTRFKESCLSVMNGGQAQLFHINHMLFAVDLDLKAMSVKCQRNRFYNSHVECRGMFKTASSGQRLIYHCGGYSKSSHAVPLLTGVNYVAPKRETDNIVHVKEVMTKVSKATLHNECNMKRDFIFRLKGVDTYRSTCICRLNRRTENGSQNMAISRTTSAAGYEVVDEPSKTWAHGGSGRFMEAVEPRCVVSNRISSRDVKCKLVKGKSKRVPLKEVVEPVELCETPELHASIIDVKRIDVNSLQTVEVVFTNPLPVKLLLEDLTLITVGIKTDVVRNNVEIDPRVKHFKVPINIVARERGRVCIVGVSFTLFEHIRCNQLFIGLSMGTAAATIEEITRDPSTLCQKMTQFIREGNCLVFDAITPVYRPVLSYQVTQPLFRREKQCDMERVVYSAKQDLNEQLLSSFRQGCSSARSRLSDRSRSTQRNDHTCKQQCGGIRIPTTKDAALPQSIKLCTMGSCKGRCISRQSSKEVVCLKSPNIDIIEGEERLIYLMIHNDSTDVVMTNLHVSVLPVLDAPEPLLSEVMTRSDREFAARKQHRIVAQQEAEYVRSFTIFATNATLEKVPVLQSYEATSVPESYRSQTPIVTRSWSSFILENDETVSIVPGTTLYVPILYRAEIMDCQYHFCVDYEYESKEGTIRASILKALHLTVGSGISMGNKGINVEPHVDFKVDDLLRNLNTSYYLPSTLVSLRSFRNIFDDDDVDVILNMVNATNKPFVCSSNGQSTFVAIPNSDAEWRISARRLNYMEAKYMKPSSFVSALDCHMNLRWDLDQSRDGELHISDLGYPMPQQQVHGCSGGQKKQFSGNDYKNTLLSHCKKSVVWKKMAAQMPIPQPKASRVPAAIHANLHHLVESKLALELTVSVGTVVYNNASFGDHEECCVNVPQGVPFELCVLARNNGDVAVDDYLTVIIPFLYGICGEPKGLSWTGSLEQHGLQSLVPANRFRPYSSMSGVHRGCLTRLDDDATGGDSYDLDNRHIPVAHLSLTAHECIIYGITAAIVVKRDRAVYWHCRPLVVHVVPRE